MAPKESFPATTLILLVAALSKERPSKGGGPITIDYALMSSLSSLTDTPVTKDSLNHAFRDVKKSAAELLKLAEEKVGDGGLAVVKATAGAKRKWKKGRECYALIVVTPN